MNTLFRPEALAERSRGWLGPVRLVRPLSMTVLTVGAAAFALVLGAWLALGEYTRKAQVAGVLIPDRGLIRLVPQAAGLVVERHVREGQQVRAGEVLFVLATERSTRESQAQVERSLVERRRSLREAVEQQSALAGAEQDALARRLREVARELDQIESEAALHRQREALARQALARMESLQADNFISPAQVNTKAEELLALKAQGQGIERQRVALQRERATLEGDLRALPLRGRSRQGEIERDLAQLEQERAEVEATRRIEVRAPQTGTVGALAVEVGQRVAPPQALASLVPEGAQLQAHLFAPSGAVGFVRPEQDVRLRVQAYAHQKFGVLAGRVVQVSRTPLGAEELVGLVPSGGGEPMFRITVALDTKEWSQPLAAGMRLDADVLLERRRLVEWLFAPVIGLKQRVAGSAATVAPAG